MTSQVETGEHSEHTRGVGVPLRAPGRMRRRLVRWGAARFPAGYASNPIRIVLMLTHRCNQRCAVCAQWGQFGVKKAFEAPRLRDELDLREYERILDQVARFRPLILLSGGEITLHKNWIPIIEAIKRRGLFAEVYTNGMTLGPAAERLVKTGLDHLKVSIDGPADIHDELRGVRGAFARAAAGVREVIEARTRAAASKPVVEVACVISDRNLAHLDAFLREVAAWGVDGIDLTHRNFLSSERIERHLERFRRDFGILRDDCWAGLRCDEPIDYVEECVEVVQKLRGARLALPVSFFPDFSDEDIRGYYTDEKFTPRVTSPMCSAPWLNGVIEPDGEVTICPNYSLGNVRDEGWAQLWNNARARALRKNLRRNGLFAGCTQCCWYYVY